MVVSWDCDSPNLQFFRGQNVPINKEKVSFLSNKEVLGPLEIILKIFYSTKHVPKKIWGVTLGATWAKIMQDSCFEGVFAQTGKSLRIYGTSFENLWSCMCSVRY